MPFRETCRMEQRIQMLSDYDTGAFSVLDLCRRYRVSRDTFYGWAARRASGEAAWFVDRPHATRSCPHRTGEAIAEEVVALRRRFPHLGPRKLKAKLEAREGDEDWPAASTIGDILKRAGLIEPVKRRRRPLAGAPRTIAAEAANDEWAADFKGWFRTKDQRRVDPLTITDSCTRFLIEARIAEPTVTGAQGVVLRAFETYGLPRAIRSDNGAPFGSQGAGGLTRLSAWWLKLGVEPHFIRPASPQENGRHERMHRTLKAQTSTPPAADAGEQQARFDAFRRHDNEERPHEALGQRPPAELYAASPRAMPRRGRGSLVRRRPRSPPGALARRNQVARRLRFRQRGACRRAHRRRRTRRWRSCRALLRPGPGHHRPPRRVPPVRSAPYGAPRTTGTRRKPKSVDHQPGPNCRGSARSNKSKGKRSSA